MSKIQEAFENKTKILAGKGATEEAIIAAERELNLSFANEYREYLQCYGIVAYNGHELTGITKSPRVNVVDVTNAEKEKNPEIPADFYVIECVNVEEIVMWQSAEGTIFCSAPNMSVKEYCKSLSDYICR